MRTSAVITLVPKHLDYLADCLADARDQTLAYDEILIVASGFLRDQESEVRLIVDHGSTGANSRILFSAAAPAGTNRNLGLEQSNGDLVFFMDADDRFHPQRNSLVMTEILPSTSFDLLLHSYLAFEGNAPKWPKSIGRDRRIWESDDLMDATFPSGRSRNAEMSGKPAGIALPNNEKVPIHHGHSVVSRRLVEAGIRQHELFFPRNEDSVYARDALWDGHRVVVTSAVLSAYRVGSSAFSWRSRRMLNLPYLLRQKLFGLASKERFE